MCFKKLPFLDTCEYRLTSRFYKAQYGVSSGLVNNSRICEQDDTSKLHLSGLHVLLLQRIVLISALGGITAYLCVCIEGGEPISITEP